MLNHLYNTESLYHHISSCFLGLGLWWGIRWGALALQYIILLYTHLVIHAICTNLSTYSYKIIISSPTLLVYGVLILLYHDLILSWGVVRMHALCNFSLESYSQKDFYLSWKRIKYLSIDLGLVYWSLDTIVNGSSVCVLFRTFIVWCCLLYIM